MKAFLCMSITEFKLSTRNFIYMFFAFVFPPMMLLLFGEIYGNDPTPFYNGHGAVDILTPAYIGMILAVSGIMGLPMQLAEYRQYTSSVLEEVYGEVMPISMWRTSNSLYSCQLT